MFSIYLYNYVYEQCLLSGSVLVLRARFCELYVHFVVPLLILLICDELLLSCDLGRINSWSGEVNVKFTKACPQKQSRFSKVTYNFDMTDSRNNFHGDGVNTLNMSGIVAIFELSNT